MASKKGSAASAPASATRRRANEAATARPGRDRSTIDGVADVETDTANRLLEAQATIERDYARLRELEARYQYLLHASSDGLLLVDGGSRRITDANERASRRLGKPRESLVGSVAAAHFDADGAARFASRLDALEAGLVAEPFSAALGDGSRTSITPLLFRQDGAPLFLVRFDGAPGRGTARDARTASATSMAEYAAVATDAIVLTDRTGLVVEANGAFMELVQVATEKQVRGVSLGRWLGRTSVDLGVLITNLRQRGTLKLFATRLRAEYGSLSDVEISAATVGGEGASAFLGFTIRDVSRRLPVGGGKRNDIARSVDQMSELVGRVPMKDIVANTAGLIEQMCIKAALELTRDNRAAAADLLGISRQSLYVKLRRYGLEGDEPR